MNINKIAKIAGVSATTVSKVINGYDDISIDTREKVMSVMSKNNYKPKVSISILDSVAIFAPIGNDTHISNPYFSGILSGVGDIICDFDYGITIVNTRRIPRNSPDFLRFCKQRKIAGGIFVLLSEDENFILDFADKFPAVVLSRFFKDYPIGSVRADNFTGGYEAVKYLVECGHKDILIIIPGLNYSDHIMRLRGAQKALDEAFLQMSPNTVEDSLSLSDMDLGYHIDRVLNEKNRPTAMFVGSDQEAHRIMRILQEKKINIPEDISIIGFDDLYFSANSNPPLTTINQPIYDMGKEACRMLIGMIQNKNKWKKIDVMLNTKLMVRKSVKRLNE